MPRTFTLLLKSSKTLLLSSLQHSPQSITSTNTITAAKLLRRGFATTHQHQQQQQRKMPYTLKDRAVLITGGSAGLGAIIARKFAEHGSNLAINYNSRKQPADELAERLRKEYSVKVTVIQGDAGVTADCERVVKTATEELGGLDVIIGNAGWTRFSDFGDLHSMSEDEWDKCWATNVKGQLALLRAALPTFNANADGGAFIITSSIAGIAQMGSSMPYSVTKAAGLHLMKCLAATQGPKIRVNAVLPGLLLTEWGKKYSEDAIKSIKDRSALKEVTSLEDCADAFIMLAKNQSMTGMKVQVDAGLVVGSP